MNPGETNRMATATVAGATTPITTAAEIKALSPELAKRQLPVSLRGVVTYTAGFSAVIQDSTRGIFVWSQPIEKKFGPPLRVGEFCQIDGVTDPGLFALLVVAKQITHLGAGQFPKPQHATRDQLVSGSLETEYAEIEGVVTAIHNRQVEVLMEGGKVTLDLMELRPEVLSGCKNAWVQIRGCVFSPFNEQTHRLESGRIRVGNAAVNFIELAPSDPFDAPKKSISELLHYDPKAVPFRLLKVSGQVIFGQDEEYFLTDGSNGLLATMGNSPQVSIGDLVDAAGFLEPGGAVVEMKEAMMRKTGHAPLPAPAKLSSEHLLQAVYAGALVQVDATLMNQWREGSEAVLELQSGFLAFKARVNSDARRINLPPCGSRVELTGVYVPQGSHAADGTVSGFELLLNSTAGIRVMATPPWWNLKRVFILAGVLAVLLLAVLVWNKELQWKVQERSRELETEIQNRHQAELQRAAEAERARIARDLHDDLGAGLTAVSLLASAGLGEFRDTEKLAGRLRAIGDKARTLVSALDVIVWAIDPRHNSLQSFADYLRIYTSEILSSANIVCRFRIPVECNPVTLTGAARHRMFLAAKEALNNTIRHASATEVELQMGQFEDRLEIVIADNGCGFHWNASRRGHGLANLQERMETLHGQCQIESQPGKGTTVKFTVPLLRNCS
jgi:signal transduction histidine kinase